MKTILMLLCALGASCSLFAQTDKNPEIFKGRWKGKGTYIYAGKMTQCSLMDMTFHAEPGVFEFTKGRRECDEHTEDFYTARMEYKDGELYFYGQKVGEFDGKVLTSWFRAPEGDGRFRNWRMSMRREGRHLMYEESRTMDGEETPLISFSGLLILEE